MIDSEDLCPSSLFGDSAPHLEQQVNSAEAICRGKKLGVASTGANTTGTMFPNPRMRGLCLVAPVAASPLSLLEPSFQSLENADCLVALLCLHVCDHHCWIGHRLGRY